MKKNYTISIPRARFWTIVLPAAVLAMIAGGVAGIIVVDRMVMPRIVGIANRGDIVVPNMVNTQCEDARQMLYDIGLRLQVAGHEYSDSFAMGAVISQQTPAGQQVKKGRYISVVVSDGPEVARIPLVRNLNERAARKALREAGFENVTARKIYDEECRKDGAIGTEPPEGVRVSREMPIVLKISSGPRPTHAIMPNVIGEMLSDAKAMVEECGLRVGKIDYRTGSSSRPGTIVSQSISPGTSIPLESSVDLVVAGSR